MKAWLVTLVTVMAITSGCRKATFKNIDTPNANSTSNNTNGGGGDGTGDGTGQPNTKKLLVTVPVKELPFGGKTTTATAKTPQGVDEPVTWSVLDPMDNPIGTIDPNGTFKTPTKGDPKTVRIIAVSKKDPTLTGEVPLKLIDPNSSGTNKPELIAKVPVPSIKIGGNTVTATAELKDGTRNPPVKWSVSGPGMRDLGKIDEKTGVYTSPPTGNVPFDVMLTAKLIADPSVAASTTLKVEPIDPNSVGLIVTVPSMEIKSGGKEMQAVATLKDGTRNPPVKWSISGPPGKDAGSISATGVYRSPNNASENFPVIITASLIANEAIKGTVSITVLKDDTIFARCMVGNKVNPIKADVYKLPDTTKFLPTDWANQNYQTTVCLDKYYVPRRDFKGGFPDLPLLEEWFGMTTTTSLIVPVEGDYEFQMTSDDGAKLWINNQEVINLDGVHQVLDKTNKIHLKAGKIPLRLDYFQGPMYEIALMLYWKKPGDATFLVVPTESFE